MSSVEDNNNISIKELISINQNKINDILNHRYTDESLLFGTIIFTQSKVQSYILNEFESEVKLKFNNIKNSNNNNNDNSNIISNNLDDLNSKYLTPGNIVDKVWIAIHHPTIKYFQSQFYYLDKESRKLTNGNNTNNNNNNSNINGNGINSNNNNNTNNNTNNNHNSNNRRNDKTLNYKSIEFRKLFDSYVKFISKCFSFYFNIIHSLINKYNLSIYIPIKKICSTLKFELSKDSIKNLIDLPPLTITDNDIDNTTDDNRSEVVSEIIYTIHKCILFIGDLSRYRTLIAKTYLPLNSISKEDNNNYSKSIELYKLSLLVLPSLGDPYNHIAIIDNLKDDKFNVVYNFMRSCLTTKPSIIGFNNLINFLSKDPLVNPIFKQFEKLNCLNRDKITKNDRLELLKTEFLILLNYYLLPNKWKLKEGYLFKNYKIKDIQNDFLLLLSKLDFHKQIFNDFYLKQLSILLGGFELLIDNNKNHPDLIQDKLIISNYLKFILKYFINMMKTSINNNKLNIDLNSNDENNDLNLQNLSILLLPMIRMMLCWFRERLLPQVFIKTNFEFLKLLSILLNSFLKFVYNNNNLINKITKNNENFNKSPFIINKPKRVRLFKEDITLNEFKPINGCLHDFDDKELYKNDEKSILALIGELPEGINDEIKNYENLLKILAIVHLGKLILNDNKVNIKFNEKTGLFDIPSPPITPQTQIQTQGQQSLNTSTPSPSQSQISSTASSSTVSLINDNLDSSSFSRNDEIANFGKLSTSNNSGKKQQYNQYSNNTKNYNNNNNNGSTQLNNGNGHFQNHHMNNGKNSNKSIKINNSYSMSTNTNSSNNRQQNFHNNNNNNVTPPQVSSASSSSSTTNLFQNTNLAHPQSQSQSSSQLNQPFQQQMNQPLPPHYQQPQHQGLSAEALISNLLSETLNNGGNTSNQVIDTNTLNGNNDFTTPSNHNFDINSLTPTPLHYPMFNNNTSGNNSNNSTPNHKINNDNINSSNPSSSNTNKFPNPSAYSMFSTFETLELIDNNRNQNQTNTNASTSGNTNPHKSLEGESFDVFANMVDSLVGDKSINNVFMNNNNNSNNNFNIQNSTLNSSNIWSLKNNNNNNNSNSNNNSANNNNSINTNNSDNTSINNSNPDTQLSTRENSIRDENSSGTDFNLTNGINTNINKDKNDNGRNNSNSNNSISNGTDFQNNFNSSNLYQNFYNSNANQFLQNSNKFYQPNQQQQPQPPQQHQQSQQTTPPPPPPTASQSTDQQQYFYNQNMPNTPFGTNANTNSPQQHLFANQYGYQQQMTGMTTPNAMQFPNYNNQAMFMQPPPPSQLQQQQQQPPQQQQFYPNTFNQFS